MTLPVSRLHHSGWCHSGVGIPIQSFSSALVGFVNRPNVAFRSLTGRVMNGVHLFADDLAMAVEHGTGGDIPEDIEETDGDIGTIAGSLSNLIESGPQKTSKGGGSDSNPWMTFLVGEGSPGQTSARDLSHGIAQVVDAVEGRKRIVDAG